MPPFRPLTYASALNGSKCRCWSALASPGPFSLHSRGSFEVFRRETRRRNGSTPTGAANSPPITASGRRLPVSAFSTTSSKARRAMDGSPRDRPSISRSMMVAPSPLPLSRRTPGRPRQSELAAVARCPQHDGGRRPAAPSGRLLNARRSVQWTVPGDIDFIGPMALRLGSKPRMQSGPLRRHSAPALR